MTDDPSPSAFLVYDTWTDHFTFRDETYNCCPPVMHVFDTWTDHFTFRDGGLLEGSCLD